MKSESFPMPKEFLNLVEEILYLCQESYEAGNKNSFEDISTLKRCQKEIMNFSIRICEEKNAPYNCKELLKILREYEEEKLEN